MEDKKHELLCKLKDLAIELGHTPNRAEFMRVATRHDFERCFGNYTLLVQASGLDPTKGAQAKAEKITNAVFNRNLENHLETYVPRPYTAPVYDVSWASISDLHFPFYCERVVKRFLEYIAKHKPDYVILCGDAWDMYSFSKYPRSHNIFTPREERALCLKLNREFWERVKKTHPGAKCYQLIGNHDLRPLKRILEAVPAAEDWANEMFQKDFTFEGVTTLFDAREELYLKEDTIAFHGAKTRLGANRDYTLMNCINAHTHAGGTVFKQIRNAVLFEANSGHAGDPESKGLTYTPNKITDKTPGFAAGDCWGPRFIPA